MAVIGGTLDHFRPGTDRRKKILANVRIYLHLSTGCL